MIDTTSHNEPNSICYIEAIPNAEDPRTLYDFLNSIEDDIDEYEISLNGLKSPEEFFEALVLRHAFDTTPCLINMATATRQEKARERERRLHAKTTKYRFVFQMWPRDPNGALIKRDNLPRKRAPNGLDIWGASLFDLYSVTRMTIPDVGETQTFSSGSRLAAWMKAHGEVKHAVDMIRKAENEPEPYVIDPWHVADAIKEYEEKIRNRIEATAGKAKAGKAEMINDWELFDKWSPRPNIFDSGAYPPAWLRDPFLPYTMGMIPKLEEYITPAFLPAKLVVHDPWKLLNVSDNASRQDRSDYEDGSDDEETFESWEEMEDITHTYKLHPSVSQSQNAQEEFKKLEDDEANRKRVREEFLKNPHTGKPTPSGYVIGSLDPQPGPCKPYLFIVYPFQENRKPIEEAHLYISPASSLGRGNHSVVYNTELELPRQFLVDEEMCQDCVIEDALEQVEEQDGDNGEHQDPRWDMLLGRHVITETQGRLESMGTLKDENGVDQHYLVTPGTERTDLCYEGPYRVIETRVHYQDLALGPYCEHLREKVGHHPLTVKVKVAAKLSKENDRHLAREAANYLKFPNHFFRHWSGYNIVRPIHEPVPIGPLVPNFYGYYEVEKADDTAKDNVQKDDGEKHDRMSVDTKSQAEGSDAEDNTTPSDQKTEIKPQYLSPILLLQECGEPIDPEELSQDDINECACLFFRFHEGHWIHGSCAPRNIVRQPGPLSEHPSKREANAAARGGLGKDWSYRLIDFGRSEYMLTPDVKPDFKSFDHENQTMRLWAFGAKSFR